MTILQSTMKLAVGAHKLLLDIGVDMLLLDIGVNILGGLFLVVVGHPCCGSRAGGYSTEIEYVEAVLWRTRGSERRGGGYREQPLWWAEWGQ